MLFVLDTNTLISAILKPDSVPMQALVTAQSNGVLLFTEETKAELLNTLPRTKFDIYLAPNLRMEVAALIFSKAKLVETKSLAEIACRDSKDVKFLRLATDAKASCLISGDKDLTSLHPFQNIPILAPADFIRWVGKDVVDENV